MSTPERKAARRIHLPPCWSCGYVQDAISAADGGPPNPDRGSIVLCLACGALAVVDRGTFGRLYVRPMNPDEHDDAMRNPLVLRALTARITVASETPDWPTPPRRPAGPTDDT